MDDDARGLYQKDYELLERQRKLLDSGSYYAPLLREALETVLEGYSELLKQTAKIHSIADRQYARLVDTQEKLLQANRELEQLSLTDKLTGLFNRRKMEEVLSEEVRRFERYGQTSSLIIMDIDLFKSVNDLHGHTAGDEVLVSIAGLLKTGIRKTDWAFRWGGEEFVIFLPFAAREESFVLAEKLRDTVQTMVHPTAGRLTASFGICEYTPGWSLDQWIREADQALYKAKEMGRNRVEG